MYGEQLVKSLKLTERMVDAMTNGGAYGTAANTTKALIQRGLASDVPGSYGVLNVTGEHVRMHLVKGACQDCDPVQPIISDAGSAAMWADRGISPRSLSLAIEGAQGLIPTEVWASEVVTSVPQGVALAEAILRGEVTEVSPMEMWMLDETADTANAVASGMALGQLERAWDAAHAEVTEVEPITSGTAESLAILSGMVAAGMSDMSFVPMGSDVAHPDRVACACETAYCGHAPLGCDQIIPTGDDWGTPEIPYMMWVERICVPCAREVASHNGQAYVTAPYGTYVIGGDEPHVDFSEPTNELPGDAERAWDAENAAAEGADIESENAREAEAEQAAQWVDVEAGEAHYAGLDPEKLAAQVASAGMHDDLLAELFPGDDDPHSTYAECGAQLVMERQGCGWCQLGHAANSNFHCVDHVSVEAWVRAQDRDEKLAAQPITVKPWLRMVAADMEPERARVTTPWKTSTSKHKRNGRTRARQVAKTRR